MYIIIRTTAMTMYIQFNKFYIETVVFTIRVVHMGSFSNEFTILIDFLEIKLFVNNQQKLNRITY